MTISGSENQDSHRLGTYTAWMCWTKGWFTSWREGRVAGDFKTWLRMARDLKLRNYFCNFLFNIFWPWLTMGNLNSGKWNWLKGGTTLYEITLQHLWAGVMSDAQTQRWMNYKKGLVGRSIEYYSNQAWVPACDLGKVTAPLGLIFRSSPLRGWNERKFRYFMHWHKTFWWSPVILRIRPQCLMSAYVVSRLHSGPSLLCIHRV